VHASLSQCYNKVNNAVDKSAVQVYRHAFSATTLNGDVQFTSISEGKYLTEGATATDLIRGMEWQPERRIGQEEYLFQNYGIRTTFVQNVW